MHKAFTLLAAALTMGSAALNAQSLPHLPGGARQDARLARLYQRLTHMGADGTAGKSTATQQRLAAQATFVNNGSGFQPLDSLTYKYSGTRGSAFNYDQLMFQTGFYPSPIPDAGIVNFDTAFGYDVFSHSIMETNTQQFNAAGRMTSYNNDNQDAGQYTYDAQGRVTSLVGTVMNSSQWENDFRDIFTYNAQGNMKTDTAYTWNGSSWDYDYVDEYSYGTGTISLTESSWDGTTWTADYKIAVTLTPANKVKTFVVQVDLGAPLGWMGIYKDSVGYTNNMLTFEEVSNFGGTGWQVTSESRRHLNAAGLPDSAFNRTMNSNNDWDTSISKLTYNTYGNPVDQLVTSTTGADQLARYYYELYQTTGIQAAPKVQNVVLYPNPATAEVHLKAAAAGRYDCRVLNNLGQVLFRMSGTAAAGETLSLPVQQLVPGQYRILMQDAKGSMYSASFVKQ